MTMIMSTSFQCMLESLVKSGSFVADYIIDSLNIDRRHLHAKSPNYISFREQKGLISFLPYGKEHIVNDDGTWSLKNRQTCKPARFVKLFFSPAFMQNYMNDVRLEEFVNEFAAYEEKVDAGTLMRFEYKQASEAYAISNYKDKFDSCMWDKGYIDYPSSAKVLVCIDGDNFLGRAIVWDCERIDTGEKIKLMDRIYGVTTSVHVLFKNYAKEAGMYHKEFQSYDSKKRLVSPTGEKVMLSLSTTWDNMADDTCYPYMDTFTYGRNNSLFNELIVGNDIHQFSNTDGEASVDDFVYAVDMKEIKRKIRCEYLEPVFHDSGWYDVDNVINIEGINYFIKETVRSDASGFDIFISNAYRITINLHVTYNIEKNRFMYQEPTASLVCAILDIEEKNVISFSFECALIRLKKELGIELDLVDNSCFALQELITI